MDSTKSIVSGILRYIQSSETESPSETDVEQSVSRVLGGTSLSQTEIEEFLGTYSFQLLFSILSSPSKEEVDGVCELLRRLLSSCDISQLLLKLGASRKRIQMGMIHVNSNVRSLVLDFVNRLSNDPSKSKDFLLENGLFVPLLKVVADPEITLSTRASKIILKYSVFPEVVDCMIGSNGIHAGTVSPDVHFRYLDLFVYMSSLSSYNAKTMESKGVPSEVGRLYMSSDPLVKLNAAELLVRLTKDSRTLAGILNGTVFDQLIRDLKDLSILPTMHCALIDIAGRSFGDVSSKDRSLAERILAGVIYHLMNDELGTQENALAAIVDISRSSLGVVTLSSFENQVGLKVLASFIDPREGSNSGGNLRIGALHAFANALEVEAVSPSPENDDIAEQLNSVQKKILYNVVIPESHQELFLRNRQSGKSDDVIVHSYVPSLMGFLRMPIEELRWACLHFISAAVLHDWGVRVVMQWNEFFEYSLDRSTEDAPLGMEWKNSVIRNIVNTVEKESEATELITTARLESYRKYLREGVFFVPSEANVKVETEGV